MVLLPLKDLYHLSSSIKGLLLYPIPSDRSAQLTISPTQSSQPHLPPIPSTDPLSLQVQIQLSKHLTQTKSNSIPNTNQPGLTLSKRGMRISSEVLSRVRRHIISDDRNGNTVTDALDWTVYGWIDYEIVSVPYHNRSARADQE